MTPTEYIKRKYALQYTTYIRRDGQGFYLVDGVEVPESEFKAANKLPLNLYQGKPNPNTKLQHLY